VDVVDFVVFVVVMSCLLSWTGRVMVC
jgi:hypothetical protein